MFHSLMLRMGIHADRYLPKNVVRHPLASLSMLLWLALGVSLLHAPTSHPWPLLLWPAAQQASTADTLAVYLTGLLITIAALLYLVGITYERLRVSDYLQWMGVWLSIFTCFVLAVSVPIAVWQGYVVDPIWPFSVAGWLVIQFIFWLEILKMLRDSTNAN